MKDMVTALREERKGYRVTVNDTETFHLTYAQFRSLPLAEGQALDWEEYRHSLLLLQYPRCAGLRGKAAGNAPAQLRRGGAQAA